MPDCTDCDQYHARPGQADLLPLRRPGAAPDLVWALAALPLVGSRPYRYRRSLRR